MNVVLRVPFLTIQEWISCRDDSRSSIDLAHDASFCHRYRLLLHCLVDRSLVLIPDDPKLIDCADAAVGQD